MLIHPVTGLLDAARFSPSPNCDPRPEGLSPEVLIVHNISLPPGQFGGDDVECLFRNRLDWSAHPFFQEIRGARVSAHFLIRRSGEVIQFVPVHLRAWHAGVSQCEGRDKVNDFSVGIELEGTDEQSYESVQYQQLAELTRAIMARFPAITGDRIYGHSDIAPDRKTDPGPAFDWRRYRQML